MELLDSLCDPNKSIDNIRVKVQSSGANVILNYDSDKEEDELEEFNREIEIFKTTSYAREYQLREEQLYVETTEIYKNDGQMSQVDYADDMLSNDDKEEVRRIKENHIVEVYTKYPFKSLRPQKLSIDNYRSDILSFIHTNQVVIIEGPTGCGKTTQVPQFILDDCKASNKYCKIVVTQPRRIAAISVARRVCEERGWGLGSVCGYQVGLETCAGSDTLLTYVTTGILLQKLVKQKNLHEFTHIIVDEVHERNQDMDFLLLIVRKFLYTTAANVKIILMSATFDTDVFAHYFRTPSRNALIEAPVISISKPTNFTVCPYYVEQLEALGEIPNYNINDPKIEPSLYKLCTYLIRAFDRLDETDSQTNKTIIGNVLVFLPGILEIEELHRHLQMKRNSNLLTAGVNNKDEIVPRVQWNILPLHSSVTVEEQRKVFLPSNPGVRKIILSTNIAESSITVPDIVYVIDFCLTKTMVIDSHTQYQSLQLQWASRVNCIQRAGRTGRVCNGRVYRLVTRNFFERELPQNVTPEIVRAPLDRTILATKLLELNEPPKAILALAMDPPNLANIESTIWNLKEAGGLLTTCNGQKISSDGDLTFLGRVMANLPLDIHLSKFIVLGHMFSCLHECIIMASGVSLNRIFSTPFLAYLKAYTNRLQWADGSCSDLIAYLNLYRVWQQKKRTAFRSKQGEDEKEWAKSNFVSLRALKEWEILVKEVRDRVYKMGMRETLGAGRVRLSEIELPIVIKVLICGAFYPNYFRRSADAGQVDEREAVKILGGHDPCNTVYFTNFDPYQPGPLYAQRIKELFTQNHITQSPSNIQINFDSSSRVYVTFINNMEPLYKDIDKQHFLTRMPGKITVEVYRSIRMRQLNIKPVIRVLKRSESWKIAESFGIDSESQKQGYANLIKENKAKDQPVLPSLDQMTIRIKVSEVIDAGHFWAQLADDEAEETLEFIFNKLNKAPLEMVNPENLKEGELYATRFIVDNCIYRCKVLGFRAGRQGKSFRPVQIIFIDYGNMTVVKANELFCLPEELDAIPPQAIECMLSEIQPSLVLNPRAVWSESANRDFDRYTRDIVLTGKIYSVVNGVVHLELYRTSNFSQTSLNKFLIDHGYAQKAEESFLSKENHQKRLLAQSASSYQEIVEDTDMYRKVIKEVSPPDESKCSMEIRLRGPFSPLEMRIYGMIASGVDKQVKIEGNSVNAVLLDTDPQDPHERLVVAAQVDQNVSGSSLILRHTTVMPNIHGFPMIMTLLFCPLMECKPTQDGTKVAAILCGLGAHEYSNRSLYPPHDLVLILDTKLTDEVLNLVNEVRFWMNMTIKTMDCLYSDTSPPVDVENCQEELKKKLFELLKAPRNDTEREFVKYANVWGKLLYDAEQLLPGDEGNMQEDVIWPLHTFIKLNSDGKNKAQIQNNLVEMEDMAQRVVDMNIITCKACNVTLNNVNEIRRHLALESHKENANQLLDMNNTMS